MVSEHPPLEKSCLDWGLRSDCVSDQLITTQIIRVWMVRPFVDGARGGVERRCVDFELGQSVPAGVRPSAELFH